MQILVGLKQLVDYSVNVRVKSYGTSIVSKVITVSCGTTQCQATLRMAINAQHSNGVI